MSEELLQIQTEFLNSILLIRIQGDMTSLSEPVFTKVFPWNQPDFPKETNSLVLDFTKTDYINSAGIASLIRFLRDSKTHSYTTHAFGLSAHYQKIFRIVGITSYIELFTDEYTTLETLIARQKAQT